MSLVAVKKPDDKWTVIIVDYESTDVNVGLVAKQILEGYIDFVVHTEIGTFSRGTGLHIAAKIAKQRNHEILFFCDADMYFTQHYVFDDAKRELNAGKVYYPICFSFIKPDHLYGFWRDTGYGMLFIKTNKYFQVKKWTHNISWGEEDNEMRKQFTEDEVSRNLGIGFFHQWHPNSIEYEVDGEPFSDILNKSNIKYIDDIKKINNNDDYYKLLMLVAATK
jgi:hypothetical protein